MTTRAASPGLALHWLRHPQLPDQPDVRVCLFDVGDPRRVAAAYECLDATERARARRGTTPVRTRRILLRAGLRQALGEVLDLDPADVPLAERAGRPQIAGAPLLRPIDANCAASDGLGVVAIASDARVGVDLQRHESVDLDTVAAERWLTAREYRALVELPVADRPLALTRCWTQKEAVLKGLGVGLRMDPRRVETRPAEQGAGRVGDWHVTPLEVPQGWVASLAVRPESSSALPSAQEIS